MTQRYEQASQKLSLKQIIFNNFIGGISWALGATIGLSLIVTLLGLIAHNINVVPIIGSFVSNIIDFVLKTNHSLQK